jgi:hypothetical protein
VLNSSETYDPATGTWSPAASIAVARYSASQTALPNGNAFIIGGITCCPYHWFNEAEVYDTLSLAWTPTSQKQSRANGPISLIAGGKVLVAGGVNGTQPTSISVPDAEVFDPSTGTWNRSYDMSIPRNSQTLTTLPSGQVLAAGGCTLGWGGCGAVSTAELYNPATGSWSSTGSMSATRSGHAAVGLPNGQVLVTGGSSDSPGVTLSSAELYTPPRCTLDVNLSYSAGSLSSSGSIGTTEPATFSLWLVRQGLKPIFSKTVPVIAPPRPWQFTMPVSTGVGTIGEFATLTTSSEGIICWAFQTADTGGTGPSPAELQRLIEPMLKPTPH